MTIFVEIRRLFIAAESYTSIKPSGIPKYFHSERFSPVGTSNLAKRVQSNVGIFWDLHNKPPKSLTPCEAGTRLKKAMIEFGFVKHMIAFVNQHSFRYVPPEVVLERKRRKAVNQLGGKGLVKLAVPYKCGVCKRRFHTNEKLTYHFKQIHESEHMKRLKQIESAKGRRMVYMIAKYSMKMDKYKKAARGVLTPKTGYGLEDELKRAGFWVRTVSDEPQAANIALRNCMVDMMDKKLIDCVVLVSDDSDFVGVLREAKDRCLRTVVVGDSKEGLLKRTADAAFSWHEIMIGKAKTQAVKVVERLKDKGIMKRLDWTYNPDIESSCEGSDNDDDDDQQTEGGRAWWKLDSCIDSEEKIHVPNETKSTGRSV